MERQKMEYDQSQTSLKDFPTSYQEWELAGGREGTGKTYAEYLSTESSNPTLDAIRMLTLSNMQSQYAPANGQLYYKATGKVATDLAASTVQKITILRTFSDSAKNLIPRIMSLLEDPDVDVSKAMGWFKQWGYQGFGKYLSGTALSNEKERSLMDLMTTLNNEYLYARSGAQINESEQARLSKTMPQTGLTSSENMNRLNNFAGTIDAILNENLKINGLGIWGEGTGATGAKNSNQEIMEDIEYLMSEQTGSSYSGIVNIVDKLFPLYPEYSRQEIMDMVNSY
jgi:hypothetical protein